MSRIRVIRNPASCSPRIAVSLPRPGPLTITAACLNPCASDCFAAVVAAVRAANAVFFRAPLKPQTPAEHQEITSPLMFVIVTIVLLNVAWMCTTPLLPLFARLEEAPEVSRTEPVDALFDRVGFVILLVFFSREGSPFANMCATARP